MTKPTIKQTPLSQKGLKQTTIVQKGLKQAPLSQKKLEQDLTRKQRLEQPTIIKPVILPVQDKDLTNELYELQSNGQWKLKENYTATYEPDGSIKTITQSPTTYTSKQTRTGSKTQSTYTPTIYTFNSDGKLIQQDTYNSYTKEYFQKKGGNEIIRSTYLQTRTTWNSEGAKTGYNSWAVDTKRGASGRTERARIRPRETITYNTDGTKATSTYSRYTDGRETTLIRTDHNTGQVQEKRRQSRQEEEKSRKQQALKQARVRELDFKQKVKAKLVEDKEQKFIEFDGRKYGTTVKPDGTLYISPELKRRINDKQEKISTILERQEEARKEKQLITQKRELRTNVFGVRTQEELISKLAPKTRQVNFALEEEQRNKIINNIKEEFKLKKSQDKLNDMNDSSLIALNNMIANKKTTKISTNIDGSTSTQTSYDLTKSEEDALWQDINARQVMVDNKFVKLTPEEQKLYNISPWMGEGGLKDIKSIPAYQKAWQEERKGEPLVWSLAKDFGGGAKLIWESVTNLESAKQMAAYSTTMGIVSALGFGPVASIIDTAYAVPDIVKGVAYPTKRNRALAAAETIDLMDDVFTGGFSPVHMKIRLKKNTPKIVFATKIKEGKRIAGSIDIIHKGKSQIETRDYEKFSSSINKFFKETLPNAKKSKHDEFVIKYNEVMQGTGNYKGELAKNTIVMKTSGSFTKTRTFENKKEITKVNKKGEGTYQLFRNNELIHTQKFKQKFNPQAYNIAVKRNPLSRTLIEKTTNKNKQGITQVETSKRRTQEELEVSGWITENQYIPSQNIIRKREVEKRIKLDPIGSKTYENVITNGFVDGKEIPISTRRLIDAKITDYVINWKGKNIVDDIIIPILKTEHSNFFSGTNKQIQKMLLVSPKETRIKQKEDIKAKVQVKDFRRLEIRKEPLFKTTKKVRIKNKQDLMDSTNFIERDLGKTPAVYKRDINTIFINKKLRKSRKENILIHERIHQLFQENKFTDKQLTKAAKELKLANNKQVNNLNSETKEELITEALTSNPELIWNTKSLKKLARRTELKRPKRSALKVYKIKVRKRPLIGNRQYQQSYFKPQPLITKLENKKEVVNIKEARWTKGSILQNYNFNTQFKINKQKLHYKDALTNKLKPKQVSKQRLRIKRKQEQKTEQRIEQKKVTKPKQVTKQKTERKVDTKLETENKIETKAKIKTKIKTKVKTKTKLKKEEKEHKKGTGYQPTFKGLNKKEKGLTYKDLQNAINAAKLITDKTKYNKFTIQKIPVETTGELLTAPKTKSNKKFRKQKNEWIEKRFYQYDSTQERKGTKSKGGGFNIFPYIFTQKN